MKNRRSIWLTSLVVAGLPALTAVVAPSVAHAAGVSAGTLIENTTQASYTLGSGEETVTSNTVTLMVDELLDVTVTTLNPGPVAVVPGPQVLTFELTNTGNGPEAFTLLANPSVAGNDFDTVIEAIAIDSNGNGIYDEGVDALLAAPSTTSMLAADANLTVFVLVTVPAGALDGQESRVELAATAVTGSGTAGTTFAGAGEGGGNAVVGLSGASATADGRLAVGIATVSLVKSATVADPFGGSAPVPGAIITYTIAASVTGSGSVGDLLVTDPLPGDTTYVAGSLSLNGSGLTDAAGDDAGQVTAAGVAVDLGTVAAGTSHSI
ncbi:MAG TPA: hypothetical protein PKD92_09950, partial [Novosphingobium sp.]|nr:hypothetical protein [Novosphingobium sp.]